jgi:hypothetical protein
VNPKRNGGYNQKEYPFAAALGRVVAYLIVIGVSAGVLAVVIVLFVKLFVFACSALDCTAV